METYVFTKMQAAGNDYLYFDCTRQMPFSDPSRVARRLSDRHFGVGGDGIVLILPSNCADFRMRMFNADGSEAQMCGNAIRCVGKYIHDRGLSDRNPLAIETRAGIKELELTLAAGAVTRVRVDMGAPQLNAPQIPMALPDGEAMDVPVYAAGQRLVLDGVSMGNPHGVIFGADPDETAVETLGPALEKDPLFPERANIEFVQVLDDTHIKVRVWERGSGETLACGTGACAAVVAAVRRGYCRANAEISVAMRGGLLGVSYDGQKVWLSGGAEFVFDGSCKNNGKN